MDIIADDFEDMFRPPVNRSLKFLDRSFFIKKIPISAAKLVDLKQISRCRTILQHDILKLDRMQVVKSMRTAEGDECKALLLKPVVKADGVSLRKVIPMQN